MITCVHICVYVCIHDHSPNVTEKLSFVLKVPQTPKNFTLLETLFLVGLAVFYIILPLYPCSMSFQFLPKGFQIPNFSYTELHS